jgi:hypothetical protein
MTNTFKTKIALAAMILATTGAVAFAEGFDPDLANRYPGYANPVAASRTFQSAPVRLQSRNVALPTGQSLSTGQVRIPAAQLSPFEIDRLDHASSPYAGGGF